MEADSTEAHIKAHRTCTCMHIIKRMARGKHTPATRPAHAESEMAAMDWSEPLVITGCLGSSAPAAADLAWPAPATHRSWETGRQGYSDSGVAVPLLPKHLHRV